MDFHDMPNGVTAKHVAEMHQADLKIEHKYNCRGLTYWCDEKRQTAFCLIEAPDKKSIKKLHKHAHGDVPQRIIEVNNTIVESFLGRIEDPKKAQNIKLNIINEPAFRTLMAIKLKKKVLKESKIRGLNTKIRDYNKSIINITNTNNGRIAKQGADFFLMSFISVTDALTCALQVKTLHNYDNTSGIEFKIGLSSGVPVNEKKGFFETIIKVSERLCGIAKEQIIITSELKDLYESENLNIQINRKKIRSISSSDELFLMKLMDYIEIHWRNAELNIDDFSKNLGYSKSQLYRKMISITGKSINGFIQDFRLAKALILLEKKSKNISEIAFATGFNSSAYFSKCFCKKYEILPSKLH